MHGLCSISWGLNGNQLVQKPLYYKILVANLNVLNLEHQMLKFAPLQLRH